MIYAVWWYTIFTLNEILWCNIALIYRVVFDLVGGGFKSDAEVDLLEKVFDLIDDVSSSVFNK